MAGVGAGAGGSLGRDGDQVGADAEGGTAGGRDAGGGDLDQHDLEPREGHRIKGGGIPEPAPGEVSLPDLGRAIRQGAGRSPGDESGLLLGGGRDAGGAAGGTGLVGLVE